jgi:hypothetical protein
MRSERKELVRRNFEAYRDLTWAEDLEPKFRQEGASTEEMRLMREAWNQFTEAKDWGWWQEKSLSRSNEELEAEITEATGYRQMLEQSASKAVVGGREQEIER